ncbi:MAG: N-acetyl-gamma-glutamyl-phosphate reductase [Treponema sp.]|jgi:N-acetyl-gamma-glutamyl-phosphate reductase|nr:N-acetyl-gamma-glutamyl-phosphate reductase [Treponema sp.]
MTAGIIGATGYAGAELARILWAHPEIHSLVLASVSHRGEAITGIYPNFWEAAKTGSDKFGSGILETPESLIRRSDIVFGALPAGTGEAYAKASLDRGVSYIDLSADFRFDEDEAVYAAWYGKSWRYPELRRRSVYGLPELNRRRIRELAAAGPAVVGNPGCYPTAVSLACYPLLGGPLRKTPALAPGSVIIADAVSGVTGAGRELGRPYHFPECSGSVSAYKVGTHRHTPEISRTLMKMSGAPVPLVFTPHLGPFNRGILATVYLPLAGTGTAEASALPPGGPGKITEKLALIREVYAAFYKDEPFVRVLPEGISAATGRVRRSNFCDISVHLDGTGSVLIVESAIDNMVKGAAGQAVQNMNLVCGFAETAGLEALPSLF